MFEVWMEVNRKFDFARDLIYVEFPTQFVYNEQTHEWTKRKKGFAIGRIVNVSPGIGEEYYLRILLNIQRGCSSYEDIRTINDLHMSDEEIRNNALAKIEKTLQGNGKSLDDCPSMPKPNGVIFCGIHNKLILDELCYDRASLSEELNKYLSCLTDEQRKVLTLTKNLRLQTASSNQNLVELRDFSDWLLKVGDGEIGDDVDVKDVAMLNDHLMCSIKSVEKSYLSSNSVCKDDLVYNTNQQTYSSKVLNTFTASGFPDHKVSFKVGVLAMLLRNIDQSIGLCNGTRLQITRLGNNVVEGKILSRKSASQSVLIPRMG
ncbi:hypothetical protein SLA2020_433110 [Shorea laevis]